MALKVIEGGGSPRRQPVGVPAWLAELQEVAADAVAAQLAIAAAAPDDFRRRAAQATADWWRKKYREAFGRDPIRQPLSVIEGGH